MAAPTSPRKALTLLAGTAAAALLSTSAHAFLSFGQNNSVTLEGGTHHVTTNQGEAARAARGRNANPRIEQDDYNGWSLNPAATADLAATRDNNNPFVLRMPNFTARMEISPEQARTFNLCAGLGNNRQYESACTLPSTPTTVSFRHHATEQVVVAQTTCVVNGNGRPGKYVSPATGRTVDVLTANCSRDNRYGFSVLTPAQGGVRTITFN